MYLADEVLPGRETARRSATDAALDELDAVYSFLYARVGNRPDAEDLAQEVALKALPRLKEGAPAAAVRAYLYATARSVLAEFWSRRLRLPESELPDEIRADSEAREAIQSPSNEAYATEVLGALAPNHRRLLELRFLQGYSLKEVATAMGKTVGSVKVMQLRALRKAAALGPPGERAANGTVAVVNIAYGRVTVHGASPGRPGSGAGSDRRESRRALRSERPAL